MEEELILIDIDGTIADFNGEFDRRWKQRHPKKIFIPSENRLSFYIEDSYPKDLEKYVTDIFEEPGFFRSLQPLEGAIDALHDLDGKGYFIRLCTAPYSSAPGCMAEKIAWITEHLGKRWVRKTIIADDKTLVKGTILIDDKPNIKGLATPEWTQLFYDQPYNRNSGGKRLIHWKFCEEVLVNYMNIKRPPKLV